MAAALAPAPSLVALIEGGAASTGALAIATPACGIVATAWTAGGATSPEAGVAAAASLARQERRWQALLAGVDFSGLGSLGRQRACRP